MGSASDDLDVVALGRISVDIYPQQTGPLRTVQTYVQALGGSATNVTVAAARLGRHAAIVTHIGDDAFAAYVEDALDGFGVDRRWATRRGGGQTPVVFAELDPAIDPTLIFYRPDAPDLHLTRQDIDIEAVAGSRLLWTTGTGLSRQPSRDTTLWLMREYRRRNPSGICIHDLDWRPMLWAESERGDATGFAAEAIAAATVVVGNIAEVDMAVGCGGDAESGAQLLLERGVSLAIVKLGARGAHARSADGTIASIPAIPITTVCGAGAGDAFGGALCHGLLAAWPLHRTLSFANAAGAIVASQLTCADAMPTAAEVEAVLAEPRGGS